MRIIIVISILLFLCKAALAQQYNSIAYTDSATNALYAAGDWGKLEVVGNAAIKNKLSYYDLYLRTATAYQHLKMNAKGEACYKKAFGIYPTTSAAQGIYNSMVNRGLSLEAYTFNEKFNHVTEIPNKYKNGVEYLYLDLGSRVPTDNTLAGNVYYFDIGRVSRTKGNVSLSQSIYYLQQDNPNSNYKQFEYAISRESYYKNGWYLNPVFHYAFTTYNSNSGDFVQPYHDSVFNNYPPPRMPVTLITNGIQTTLFTNPGTTNSFSLAYGIKKRKDALTIGFEPTLQTILDKNQITTAYKTQAIRDSLTRFGPFSYPYADSGKSSTDTGSMTFIGQLGLSIGYELPIRHMPIKIKVSGYYLFDNMGNTATAYNFYAFVMASDKYWLHLGYTSKGNLPWAMNSDGQYFNTNNAINYRTSITLQLRPLKKLSPMFTWQYEQDSRSTDYTKTVYNSFYLTLKYNL